MAKCEVCGKSVQFGHNVSHSNKKTPKMWKPNIKRLRVMENGRMLRKYVCTRCIRSGLVTKAVCEREPPVKMSCRRQAA